MHGFFNWFIIETGLQLVWNGPKAGIVLAPSDSPPNMPHACSRCCIIFIAVAHYRSASSAGLLLFSSCMLEVVLLPLAPVGNNMLQWV